MASDPSPQQVSIYHGTEDWGNGCFISSTPILMGDMSLKPIGEIRIHDTILSYDSGKLISAVVSNLHRYHVPRTCTLTLSGNGKALRTTPQQRFAVHHRSNGAGAESLHFDSAEALKQGATEFVPARVLESKLALTEKPCEEVLLLAGLEDAGPAEVWNLTVEVGHTYFVGEEGVLVHNKQMR